MRRPLLRNPRLRWRLAFASLALWVALAAACWNWVESWPLPQSIEPTPAFADAGQDQTTANQAEKTIDDYRLVWARSLHQRLIEPEPEPVAAPVQQQRGMHAQLIGTAVEGDTALAMLRLRDGSVRIAAIGQFVETYQLQSIDPTQAVLVRDGQQITLKLPEQLQQRIPESARKMRVAQVDDARAPEDHKDPGNPGNPADSNDHDKATTPTPALAPPTAHKQPPKPVRIVIQGMTSEQFMRDTRLVPTAGNGQHQPGFRIDSIAKGSPLEHAGIQPGDVIVSLDGKALSRLADLSRLYEAMDARVPHQWEMVRGTQKVTVDWKLEGSS